MDFLSHLARFECEANLFRKGKSQEEKDYRGFYLVERFT